MKHFNRGMCSKLDDVFSRYLKDIIALWERRAEHVVVAEPAVGITIDNDLYMIWYRRITRTLIGNLVHQTKRGYQTFAERHEALGRGLHRLYHMGIEMQVPDKNSTSQQ